MTRKHAHSLIVSLFLSLFWSAVGTTYGGAPDDALRVAQTYFKDHWKPIAESDPKAFDVDGIDISAAALGSPSGIYFIRMAAGSYTETRKIVRLK